MCFTHRYDWWPEVEEQDHAAKLDHPAMCDECERQIPAGQPHYFLFQQEHDETWWLPPAERDEDYHGPAAEEFDPGENDEYRRCRDCSRLIEAIRASEEAAGCKGISTVPMLLRLMDAMHDEGDRYAAMAREMFPPGTSLALPEDYLAHMLPKPRDDGRAA